MSFAKIASVVVALHLIMAGFFFFKPPLNYFAVICLSTIIVWAIVFSLGRRKRWACIIAGLLLQVIIQQIAYHWWLREQVGICWPLAQFLGLQYLVAFRLGSSPQDAPEMRNSA